MMRDRSLSCMSPGRKPVNILALVMNVDCFQPYKDISYSVGAVIINLPRNIRYSEENVMIIDIIPGPHESKKHKFFSWTTCQ